MIIRSLSGEAVNRYPVNEVLEIKTPQVSAHAEGLRQMAAGRIEPAVQQFEDALKQEDRVWVRREILALLVRCALRQGNYVTAGTRFELLYESDPTTAHFKLIPLKWSPGEISDETRIGAQVAMAREPEVSRLIGASLLLDVPRLTRGAELVLKELATSSDARIQSLAQVQGWRLPIAAGPVANVQLNLWQKRVDALPSDLRGGPAYLLGRAYRGRREHELAAASLLWLPLVDDHDYNLAARACLEAGESLGAIGQEAEADVLYAEVVRRYPDSPFAAEARTLLDRRTQPRAGSRSEDGESAQDEPPVSEKN